MEQVRQAGADALLLAALDEIAWAFNIRGTDVECNPVVICYAYIPAYSFYRQSQNQRYGLPIPAKK